MNKSTLFIGGSYDGKWIEVPESQNTVELLRPTRTALIAELFGLEGEKEIYQRFALYGRSAESLNLGLSDANKGSELFYVFVPTRLSADEVMAWVVAGYAREKISCEQ